MLDNDKSPSRRTGELDNRGSHYYLAKYWAEELANQDQDSELKISLRHWLKRCQKMKTKIVAELNDVQGQGVDIGGYYQPDQQKLSQVMYYATFNQALAAFDA